MEDGTSLIGGALKLEASDWQFWVRILSQAAITFAGISFAAWFGYRNAKKVFELTQETRANRFLSALEMEMCENLRRTKPILIYLVSSVEKFDDVNAEDYVPPLSDLKYEKEVYQGIIEFIGHYPPDVGRGIVSFYSSLEAVKPKFAKPDNVHKTIGYRFWDYHSDVVDASSHVVQMAYNYRTILDQVIVCTGSQKLILGRFGDLVSDRDEQLWNTRFSELSGAEKEIAWGYQEVEEVLNYGKKILEKFSNTYSEK